jgi:hypothetical protein
MLDSYKNIMESRPRKSRLPLVQPGMPSKSSLYQVLTSGDQEVTMPPHNLNMPGLKERDIERIRLWITEGARDN